MLGNEVPYDPVGKLQTLLDAAMTRLLQENQVPPTLLTREGPEKDMTR